MSHLLPVIVEQQTNQIELWDNINLDTNVTAQMSQTIPPRRQDCSELAVNDRYSSSIYTITPTSGYVIWCVLWYGHCQYGGWTVFQKGFDGSVDFHRSWGEYERDFVDSIGEFWLGLHKLHSRDYIK